MLPGGGIEPGESRRAAVRELAEECSLPAPWCAPLRRRPRRPPRRTSWSTSPRGAGARRPRGEQSETTTSAALGDAASCRCWPASRGIAELVVEAWPLRVGRRPRRLAGRRAAVAALPARPLGVPHSSPARRPLPSAPSPGVRRGDDSVGYLARLGDVPCGFALVHGVTRESRLMGEFFVTRSARGRGVAGDFAREVFVHYPGGGRSRSRTRTRGPRRSGAAGRRGARRRLEKTFAVPGKPHLPPDVWLSGTQPSRGRPAPRSPGGCGSGRAGPRTASCTGRSRRRTSSGRTPEVQPRLTVTDARSMSSARASAEAGSSSSALRGFREPANDETASVLSRPDALDPPVAADPAVHEHRREHQAVVAVPQQRRGRRGRRSGRGPSGRSRTARRRTPGEVVRRAARAPWRRVGDVGVRLGRPGPSRQVRSSRSSRASTWRSPSPDHQATSRRLAGPYDATWSRTASSSGSSGTARGRAAGRRPCGSPGRPDPTRHPSADGAAGRRART